MTIEDIASISALEGAGTQALQAIADKAVCFEVIAGTEIIGYLDQSDEVYFVLEGGVRANMVAASGRQITYQTLGPGSHFGEFAAIDALPRSKSVVAETDSILARLAGDDFLNLVRTYPDFALTVMRWVVTTSRWYSEKLFEYHTYDVTGRILAELLRKVEEAGELRFTITDRDMATRVGTTRENVTRTYGKLRAAGIIERTGSQIRVLDVDRLKKKLADCEFS